MRQTRLSLSVILLLAAFVSVQASSQSTRTSPSAKGSPMTQHAVGTFDVNVKPLGPASMEGVARFSIDKTLHGDLEATTRGEMYTAGDPKAGAAGYVAIETVTGSLAGRRGSFVLQHFATMDSAGPSMTVSITPGSGTGGFAGITGTLTISIADGKHSYELTYNLPPA